MFQDRKEAGVKLAQALQEYRNSEAIVLGLPRGGVVVAYEIAKDLHLPLDILCPRKIGAPQNQEFAIGAITETGQGSFNEEVIKALGISSTYIQKEIEKQKHEADRRLKIFRGDRPALKVEGKEVILIDDGLATGLTMKAAIASLKEMNPSKIIVAIPVAPTDTAHEIKNAVDHFVCLLTSNNFYAVGQFYQIFDQTTDQEVIDLLKPKLRP